MFSPEPGKDALRASSIYKSIDSKLELNLLPTIKTKSNNCDIGSNFLEKHKPKVTAKSWAIYDAYTGNLLCDKNS